MNKECVLRNLNFVEPPTLSRGEGWNHTQQHFSDLGRVPYLEFGFTERQSPTDFNPVTKGCTGYTS